MAKIAVIKTGGKQYKVAEGQTIQIEKLAGEAGAKLEFDQVLLVADQDGKEVELGNPIIKGKKVTAVIDKQFRSPKITVVKYKAKVRYRRKKGHKQHQTQVKIGKIS